MRQAAAGFGTRVRRARRGVSRRGMLVVLTALSVVAIAAPVAAHACNIPIRNIGPFEVKRHDLRRPVERVVQPSQWKLDATWTSVVPQLNQVLRTRRVGSHVNVSFAAQRSLSIDALPPDTYGWRWIDDRNPSTTCELAGRHVWESPKVRTIETAREIRILAVSRQTPGSAAGCALEDSTEGLPCPNITTTIVRLKRAVGTRRIVFERFAD